jgi:hypothetical protein
MDPFHKFRIEHDPGRLARDISTFLPDVNIGRDLPKKVGLGAVDMWRSANTMGPIIVAMLNMYFKLFQATQPRSIFDPQLKIAIPHEMLSGYSKYR